MTVVRLTEEQEAIAQSAMATGRYNGPQEVIDAALKLLKTREEQREAFQRSLDDARREGEERGYVEIDEVAVELDAIIAEAEAKLAASSGH